MGLVLGRKAWIERLHAAGLKAPGWPKGIPKNPRKRLVMAREIVVREIARLEERRSSGLATALEESLALGFRRIQEYLSLEESAGEASDATEELKRKQAALTSELIRSQGRLDDTLLRAQRDDRLLELLERLKEESLPIPTSDDEG